MSNALNHDNKNKEDFNFVTPQNKRITAVKRTATTAVLDSPFVIPPSPLMKKLGCGTHVTVYRYKRKKVCGEFASPWAIKKANKGHARPSILDRLKDEASILRSLDHPNIVAFKKFTTTENGDMCLSMEAFGKGLDDLICSRQEDEELFSATQIMQVTWSIANALDYLHNNKKLLHGDVKSGNILVKGDDFENVKLCDFGVSIFLKDDLSGPKNPKATYIGSEPWHCKEVLEDGPITDKADIFAYGLVIWEMLALDVPHVRHMTADESSSDLDGSFLGTDDMSSFSLPDAYFKALGTRPALPDYEYSERYDPVIGTFICCTIEDYTRRPCADDVVKSLHNLVKEFGIQPDKDGGTDAT